MSAPKRNDAMVAPLLFALPLAALLTAVQAIGASWLPVTALSVAVLVAVGTGIRLAGSDTLRTRALAWWLQAAALVGILVLREAVVSDWQPAASLSSGIELLQSLGLSVGQGVTNIAWYVSIPLPASAPTTTVLVLAAGILTLLNDLVLRVTRLPAMTALWLFLPAVIPMILQLRMNPLLLGPVAILFVLALLTCGSKSAGRVTRKTGMIALAATAAIVIALPLAIPDPRANNWRFPEVFTRGSWLTPVSPQLSENIDLASHLSRPDPVEIMTYTTSDGAPTRFELTTLRDTSQGGFTESDDGSELLNANVNGGPHNPQFIGEMFDFEVDSRGFNTRNLPVPEQYTALYDLPDRVMGFDSAAEAVRLEPNETELEAGFSWRGSAARVAQNPMDYQGLTDGPPLNFENTLLPPELEELRPLAEEIVGDAENDLQRMDRLVQWFSTDDWQYSEQIPFAGFGSEPDGQWQALLSFMEQRVGYCVHYASALAAMALALDIPAEVKVGFLPGEQQEDGSFSVTTNDMHAWTSVFISGIGMVSYDVTPPILAGETSASDPDGSPFGPDGTPPTPRPTESASPTPSDEASPTPSESDEADPNESDDVLDPNDALTPPDDPHANGNDAESQPEPEPLPDLRWVVMLLGIVMLLALPAIIRKARRSLRRRDGVVGAWQEILDVAVDTGVGLPQGATGAQIVLILRDRLPAELGQPVTKLRLDAEAASFGRPGAEAKPYDAQAVRKISRALWKHTSPVGSVLRHWLPPSLVPQQLRSMQQR